ncbi:MAG TPA: SIMPL domain-containing protein [Gaiellaceae bacterium]|nr:SIMPL domain-containing protein [Gaiellaceae bacterium]
MKLVVLATVAAASLAAAGCGGKDGGPEIALSGYSGSSGQSAVSAAPVQQGGAMTTSGITVVGSGTADVVPDVADWSFGVRSQASTASDALSANASAMKAVLAALEDSGVSKQDLQTTEVSLYPETADDGRTVTGYSASSTVTATVRKLGDAGKVVDAAVRAGANDVYGPSLRPSSTDEAYRQAVDKAFDDARAHAEAIAAKAGVSLGTPVAIVEGGGYVPGPVMAYDRATAAGAAEVAPVEPGRQQVSASLTVTFSIGSGA